MDSRQLAKYFVEDSGQWKIKDELRAMVAFQRIDLTKSFARLGTFDVVFCRNVAIYFTREVRSSIFSRIAEILSEPGYLFVGSSENLSDLGPQFEPQRHCRAIYYQPNRRAAVAGV